MSDRPAYGFTWTVELREVCRCGHPRGDHFRHAKTCLHSTDSETWACDCPEFQGQELTDEELADLQAELDELERTDPDVAAAADSYDRMVRKVLRRDTP